MPPFCADRRRSVLLLFVLIIVFPAVSYGSTSEEEYKKIQERIIDQKKKIEETQKREHSVLNEIAYINRKLASIGAEIRILKKKISRTRSDIAGVNVELGRTKRRLKKQRDWIKRKLRIMHKFGSSGDIVVLILSAEDISQMMRTWKYLEHITRYEHKVLGDYVENLRNLDEKNNKLLILKAELKKNEQKIRIKEDELIREKRSKQVILSSLRHKKASYLKMLSELKKASRKVLKIIRESSRRNAVSATGFSRLKARLSWPAAGKIVIPYGSQKDSRFDMPVFRNGIHIQANSNTDAKSIYKGKVIFAEWFKGFGQLIIVNHGGGYHSLYGNLSEIFSHVGDIIKENQVIGKVGTSGILNGPGLYFEIRYRGKPLDPIQWLKRKSR